MIEFGRNGIGGNILRRKDRQADLRAIVTSAGERLRGDDTQRVPTRFGKTERVVVGHPQELISTRENTGVRLSTRVEAEKEVPQYPKTVHITVFPQEQPIKDFYLSGDEERYTISSQDVSPPRRQPFITRKLGMSNVARKELHWLREVVEGL